VSALANNGRKTPDFTFKTCGRRRRSRDLQPTEMTITTSDRDAGLSFASLRRCRCRPNRGAKIAGSFTAAMMKQSFRFGLSMRIERV
jgi:hypothetical protein